MPLAPGAAPHPPPQMPTPRISAPLPAPASGKLSVLSTAFFGRPAGLEPFPKWVYTQRSAINTGASPCSARGVARILWAALTGETSSLFQSPALSSAAGKISVGVGVGGRQARRGWSLVVPGLSEGALWVESEDPGKGSGWSPIAREPSWVPKIVGSAHRQGLGSPFVHELQSQFCGVNGIDVSEPPFVKMEKLTFGELTLLLEWQSCFLMHQSTSEKRHTTSIRFQTSDSNCHIL